MRPVRRHKRGIGVTSAIRNGVWLLAKVLPPFFLRRYAARKGRGERNSLLREAQAFS